MGLYIALLVLMLCIRYSASRTYAEIFGLVLSIGVIVLQWREKGFLAILLIALIIIIRRYKNSQRRNKLFVFFLVFTALIWYGEAKYSSVSHVLTRLELFDIEFDVVIAVVGASYILMRLLNYILGKNQELSLLSSFHYKT